MSDTSPASAASGRAAASPTSARTASGSPTEGRSRGSERSPSRRPRPTSGSAPIPNGHIQATGRDARGRKQYRYHPRWREVRDETKFGRMLAFSQVLPGDPRAGRRRSRAPGPAAGEGAGDGGAAARVHRDPGGQRRVCPRQPLLRPHHAAGPARRGLRVEAAVSVPGQERQDPRRGAHRPAAGAHRHATARRSPARSCSSTSTTTARGRPSDSGDVNDYLREITGAGVHREGLPHLGGDDPGGRRRCRSWARRTPSGRRSPRSCRRSTRWPSSSTTPARCAGSTTCTRRCSRPTWPARCWKRWGTETERPPGAAAALSAEERAVVSLLSRQQ